MEKKTMKEFKVTIQFKAANHVTMEFVTEYLQRLMQEKIHEPCIIEVEETPDKFEDKL